MTEHMLTTVDNPFNPFHQFDEWMQWDVVAGYNTAGYLARVIKTSDELSDADESRVMEDAIDEIVRENLYGVHIKVTPTDVVPRVSTVEIDD